VDRGLPKSQLDSCGKIEMPMYAGEDRPRRVVIFGTGTGANTARRYFELDSPHEVVGYLVDREFLTAPTCNGCPAIAVDEAVSRFSPEDVLAFVPLGSARMNIFRTEKYQLLKSLGYRFISYVHSSNRLEGRCEVGENCFILENQSVNFDAVIGNNVVIWSGCQIGDRSRIGDHAFLAAHVILNGDVSVGEYAYLGSNCNISNGVHIARQCFIGANALITQDTHERAVHVVDATLAAGIDSLRFVRLLKKNS
jgi:sugar O-acyltransferase (sialic acid O-acetyltransferase NeuD family)